MEIIPGIEWIILFAAAFLSGFLSGSIGFASGVLPTAFLAFFMPSTIAVPLLAPIVLLGTGIALIFHWKEWKIRPFYIVLPTLLAGTYVGTLLLSAVPELLISRLIAFFIIFIALQELGKQFLGSEDKPNRLQKMVGSLPGGILLGLISGLASAIAHAGGVVISIYLISTGLKKDRFTGTILLILVLADTAKLLTFLEAGLITSAMVNPVLWALPFLLLGVYAGRFVYRRMPATWFKTVVATTLLGLGLFLW